MNYLKNCLQICCGFLFFLSGVMAYAYVFDVEPFTEEKMYSLEREAFNRNNSDWTREFPDFDTWVNDQNERELHMREWMAAMFDQVGYGAAEAFDWSYTRPQDTREGGAPMAPTENYGNANQDSRDRD